MLRYISNVSYSKITKTYLWNYWRIF